MLLSVCCFWNWLWKISVQRFRLDEGYKRHNHARSLKYFAARCKGGQMTEETGVKLNISDYYITDLQNSRLSAKVGGSVLIFSLT
jgi:hypothetical protein